MKNQLLLYKVHKKTRSGRDMDKKPVTRKDIAELCEVSISVVSRALNNSGYVEESKRKKS